MSQPPSPIPITLLTGFLGSGKTTLLLNLLPQLHSLNPTYTLALLKNEFGDLAIDSQLATQSSISSVRELLNGCICCNLVGELSTALEELTTLTTKPPDRIVIETSGSAFPATLAMEVNRIARDTGGKYALDGVVSVIDVENWKGYEDTSYTAKIQARYTDLVVFNKWELVDERRFDECLDRLGDLEVQVAWVKSKKGSVDVDLVFGIDGGLARSLTLAEGCTLNGICERGHFHDHTSHTSNGHQSEVEVLSVTLSAPIPSSNSSSRHTISTPHLLSLLRTAPKDEIYRIKAIVFSSGPIPSSEDLPASDSDSASEKQDFVERGRYILNWAFGRWTCTPLASPEEDVNGETNAENDKNNVQNGEAESDSDVKGEVLLRMTLILARDESTKWKKRLESGAFIELEGEGKASLEVKRIT